MLNEFEQKAQDVSVFEPTHWNAVMVRSLRSVFTHCQYNYNLFHESILTTRSCILCVTCQHGHKVSSVCSKLLILIDSE